MKSLSHKESEGKKSFVYTSSYVHPSDEVEQLMSDFDSDLLIHQMESLSVRQLIDYLRASHDYYLTKIVPEVEQSLIHILSKHGQSHRVLAGLALYFNNYTKKLVKHFYMEEAKFFPFVESLISAEENSLSDTEVRKLLETGSIEAFEDNHDSIEDELQAVYSMIREIATSQELVMPFEIFLSQVSRFEYELRKHAIIEDLVLIKKATELEKRLQERVLLR
jgi:regulator of cell morphogenesis and NO signaling